MSCQSVFNLQQETMEIVNANQTNNSCKKMELSSVNPAVRAVFVTLLLSDSEV